MRANADVRDPEPQELTATGMGIRYWPLSPLKMRLLQKARTPEVAANSVKGWAGGNQPESEGTHEETYLSLPAPSRKINNPVVSLEILQT